MIQVSGPASGMGSFSGPVFRPGDDGYHAERAGFNLAVDHHPELIAGATGPGDVAGDRLRLGARGGCGVLTTGHGPAVPADGQVLITTGRMNDVQVDPGARTARVGGGARWRQVLPRTVPHGLAPAQRVQPARRRRRLYPRRRDRAARPLLRLRRRPGTPRRHRRRGRAAAAGHRRQ